MMTACDGGVETGDSKGDDSGITTPSGLTVTATAKESVWRVTWDTTFSGTSRIDYGLAAPGEKSAAALTPSGTSHEVLLAGLGEAETWTLEAVTEGDGGEVWKSDSFQLEVPAAPSDLPGVVISEEGASDAEGFLLATNAYEGNSWVSLIDRDGRRTWWDGGDENDIISEAWLSSDGQHVYWLGMAEDDGELHKVSLDGETNEEWSIPDAHHAFTPMPDGTLAVVRYDVRDYDGVAVYGDDIAIYDADGNLQRVVWSSYDTYVVDPGDFPPDTDRFDWTHANSIWYSVEQELFVLSLWDFSEIVAVDANTGETRWRLGQTPDFQLLSADGFARQHAARLTEKGVLVFNNRDVEQSAEDRWSELVEFELDEEAGTYRRSWSFDSNQELYVPVLGNGDEIGDGHVMLGWGSAGRAQELDENHEVVWQLDSDLGGTFGYVHLVTNLAGATK